MSLTAIMGPQKCDQPGVTTLNLFSSFESHRSLLKPVVKREAEEEDRLFISNKLYLGSIGHG